MLVLSRQRDQSVMIGDNIEIKIVDIRGEKVRLGINAPRTVSVHRREIYDHIVNENKSAGTVQPGDVSTIIEPAPAMRMGPPAPPEWDPILRAAVQEAQASRAEGGVPIGAVLARNGQLIAQAHDRRVQTGDAFAVAEVECLRRIPRDQSLADATLYCTLSPGPMGAAAIVQLGIQQVIVGDSANAMTKGPFIKAAKLLCDAGVKVTELHDAECFEMMREFLREKPDILDGRP